MTGCAAAMPLVVSPLLADTNGLVADCGCPASTIDSSVMLLVQFQVMPWGGSLSYLLRHSRLWQCDKSKVRLRIFTVKLSSQDNNEVRKLMHILIAPRAII